MRAVIVGAGEFGRNLATTFRNDHHDVVVVDANAAVCARLRAKLDIMTVVGAGTSLTALKEAGIGQADLLVAVTNDDAVNLAACRIAKHFQVGRTVCRLATDDCFSPDDGLTPAALGVDYAVIPGEECVHKILNVLDTNSVLEKIVFGHPDAIMTAIRVMHGSPIAGVPVRGFPDPAMLSSVRFCGIVRNHRLVIPHGETIVSVGDELYISGRRDKVRAATAFINPGDRPIQRVVIAGGGDLGLRLAQELAKRDYEVRLIEPDAKVGEALLQLPDQRLMVIHGEPTSDDILDEAGVAGCDAFVGVQDDDEDNILACILAKRQGAAKVIATTNKSEYAYIVPTIATIDCGFSTRLVASNSVLHHPVSGTLSVNAILHRVDASIYEFTVAADAPIAGRMLRDHRLPQSAVLALVFRDDETLVPAGDLIMLPGDVVAAMATAAAAKELQPHFRPRGWLAR